jgi:hypothetical protein
MCVNKNPLEQYDEEPYDAPSCILILVGRDRSMKHSIYGLFLQNSPSKPDKYIRTGVFQVSRNLDYDNWERYEDIDILKSFEWNVVRII